MHSSSQGAAGPEMAISGGVQISQPEVQTEAEAGLRQTSPNSESGGYPRRHKGVGHFIR